MRENADQINGKNGHVLRSESLRKRSESAHMIYVFIYIEKYQINSLRIYDLISFQKFFTSDSGK